jgi:hypothetical protein
MRIRGGWLSRWPPPAATVTSRIHSGTIVEITAYTYHNGRIGISPAWQSIRAAAAG